MPKFQTLGMKESNRCSKVSQLLTMAGLGFLGEHNWRSHHLSADGHTEVLYKLSRQSNQATNIVWKQIDLKLLPSSLEREDSTNVFQIKKIQIFFELYSSELE